MINWSVQRIPYGGASEHYGLISTSALNKCCIVKCAGLNAALMDGPAKSNGDSLQVAPSLAKPKSHNHLKH